MSLEKFGLLVPSLECTKFQQQDNELRPRSAGPVIDSEYFVWGATAILLRVYVKNQAERLVHFLYSSGLFTCDAYLSFGLFLAWFLVLLVLLLVAYYAISFRVVFILWTLFMWIKPVNISVVFCQIWNKISVKKPERYPFGCISLSCS